MSAGAILGIGCRTSHVDPSALHLLARERGEDDVAPECRLARGERARHLDERRRAGGVVVRAEVRLVTIGRERIAPAVAEVIVVRSDDDDARQLLRVGHLRRPSREHVERGRRHRRQGRLDLRGDPLLLLEPLDHGLHRLARRDDGDDAGVPRDV